MKTEIEVKKVFLAICLTWFVASPVLSQRAPTGNRSQNPAPQTTTPAPKPSTQQPPAKQPAATNPTVTEDFVIGPEDVLSIAVWREPDLATKAVVRPDGKIGVTLLGDVQASGLTTGQLKENIAKGLTRYVAEPEVSVVVAEIHSQTVHLIGAVGRPGAYSLGGPLTIMELLARAGGIAEGAKSEDIAIVRTVGKTTQRIPFNYKAFIEGRDLMHNILLKNGDVIVVRQ